MGVTKELFAQFQERLYHDMQAVEEGNICPLELFIAFKEEEKYLKEYQESIKEWIKENAEEIHSLAKEHPDGLKGYNFELRNGSSKWNFKDIEEYDNAIKVVNENKAIVKQIENKYKNAYNQSLQGIMAVDEETGEVLKLPSKKQSYPIVILKPKKQ